MTDDDPGTAADANATGESGTAVRRDRFSGGPAREFLSSLAADAAIFEADLAVDRAHTVMLAEQGDRRRHGGGRDPHLPRRRGGGGPRRAPGRRGRSRGDRDGGHRPNRLGRRSDAHRPLAQRRGGDLHPVPPARGPARRRRGNDRAPRGARRCRERAHGDGDARLHAPPAGPADDGRALPAVVRGRGRPRHRAPARRVRPGQPVAARCGRVRGDAVRYRPRSDCRAARVRRDRSQLDGRGVRPRLPRGGRDRVRDARDDAVGGSRKI